MILPEIDGVHQPLASGRKRHVDESSERLLLFVMTLSRRWRTLFSFSGTDASQGPSGEACRGF